MSSRWNADRRETSRAVGVRHLWAGSLHIFWPLIGTSVRSRLITINLQGQRFCIAFWLQLMYFSSIKRNQASLERRGFDAETICKRYPRLIYCAISGYGHSGPRSGLPGYDIIAQAQAGIMSFTGEPDGELGSLPNCDCGYGVRPLLCARNSSRAAGAEKTGAGQALDMALFDSQLSLLVNAGSNYLNAGESPQRWGNAHPSIVPYQVFRGGDGRHFVAAIGTDALWQRFLRVIDAAETLGTDPTFSHQRTPYGTSPGADSSALYAL